MARLGRLVTYEALYNELPASRLCRDVTDYITAGVARWRPDHDRRPNLAQDLSPTSGDDARINTGQGALGRFLNDEAMGRSPASTMTSTEQITGRLTKGEGTAGKLLTDQQLYDRLNSVAGRVDQVVAGLESGQGTAGQLLRDQKPMRT